MSAADGIPDWLTVGAVVASVTHDRSSNSVRRARVARIGKRDVVLDNDERFPVRTLVRREGGTWSTRVSRLMRADDPHVVDTLAGIRQQNLRAAAINACNEFGRTGSVGGSSVCAADVILALAPLTGVADEIAALFDIAD